MGACRQVVTQIGRMGVFGEELEADKQAQTRLPSRLPNPYLAIGLEAPPESTAVYGEETDPVRNDKQ